MAVLDFQPKWYDEDYYIDERRREKNEETEFLVYISTFFSSVPPSIIIYDYTLKEALSPKPAPRISSNPTTWFLIFLFVPLSCEPAQALLTNRAFQSLQPEILHLAPEATGNLRLGLHSNHIGNSRPVERPAENSQASTALLIIQLNFVPEAWSPGTQSPTLNFILTLLCYAAIVSYMELLLAPGHPGHQLRSHCETPAWGTTSAPGQPGLITRKTVQGAW